MHLLLFIMPTVALNYTVPQRTFIQMYVPSQKSKFSFFKKLYCKDNAYFFYQHSVCHLRLAYPKKELIDAALICAELIFATFVPIRKN